MDDNLDVTSASKGESSTASSKSSPMFLKPEAAGLSLWTKLFWVSVVIAGCVVFLKTRRDGSAALGKQVYA
jgi:hypothetical protein